MFTVCLKLLTILFDISDCCLPADGCAGHTMALRWFWVWYKCLCQREGIDHIFCVFPKIFWCTLRWLFHINVLFPFFPAGFGTFLDMRTFPC